MNPTPELLPSALNMAAALAAVLGGLFLLLHLGRRYLQRPAAAGGQPLVRVVASHPLGLKKSVALIEVPGAVLVLGLSGDRIQMLTRIEDPEALERIRTRTASAPVSFTEHLLRLGLRRHPGERED